LSCSSERQVAITIVVVWIIGPGFNVAYMTPSAKITDSGDCTVYSEWPDKVTQTAVGVFTVFLQFILPLMMLAYGYTRMALVLHRRVETAEAPAAGELTSRDVNKHRRSQGVHWVHVHSDGEKNVWRNL